MRPIISFFARDVDRYLFPFLYLNFNAKMAQTVKRLKWGHNQNHFQAVLLLFQLLARLLFTHTCLRAQSSLWCVWNPEPRGQKYQQMAFCVLASWISPAFIMISGLPEPRLVWRQILFDPRSFVFSKGVTWCSDLLQGGRPTSGVFR